MLDWKIGQKRLPIANCRLTIEKRREDGRAFGDSLVNRQSAIGNRQSLPRLTHV
ncbi:MAG: hypothetical protein NT031_01560 [Planctomycetota bacterium]|nr:hypothetical protein [Planctomycetota bacterium]